MSRLFCRRANPLSDQQWDCRSVISIINVIIIAFRVAAKEQGLVWRVGQAGQLPDSAEQPKRPLMQSESAKRRQDVRLRVRTNSRVRVPVGQKHWSVRSGRQVRRREVGGAAGSERLVHG
jgi:hypothetical protein